MKKRLLLVVATILVIVLAFTGCEFFQKTVTKMEAVNLDEILAEIGEIKVDDELDLSELMVRVSYSDGSFKMIGKADGLEIEDVDTSKSGTVTVKFTFEGVEGSFTIQVNDRELDSIEIDDSLLKKEIIVGEVAEYDASGIKVTAKYKDGTEKLLAAGEYQVVLPDVSTSGTKTLKVYYGDASAEVEIKVKSALAISVDHSSIASTIEVGEEIDISDIVVKLVYSDGSNKVIDAGEYTTNFASLDFTTAGKKTVVVTYGDFSDDFDINVKAGAGITVDASALSAIVMAKGELDLSKLVVTLKYSDNSTRVLDATEYTTNIDDIDFTTGGAKTVQVSFDGYSATFSFTVKVVTSIEVDASAVEKTVMTKDQLDLSALIVKVKYNVGADETLAAADYTTNVDSLDFTVGGALTVTVSYGSFTDTFDIFVKKATGIQLDAEDVELDLTPDQDVDYTNLKVYLVYNIGSPVLLESGYTVEELNRENADERKLVVSYDGFTAELKIQKATLTGITVAGTVDKVLKGETPDYSKLTFTANYSNGSSKQLALSDVEISVDTTVVGNREITVSYDGKTATASVLVYAPEKLELVAGSFVGSVRIDKTASYSIDGLKIKVVYTDGTSREVQYTTNFASIDLATAGEKSLVVSAEDLTLDLTINVIGIQSLEIVGVLDSYKDVAVDLSAVTVKVTFAHGETEFVNLADIENNIASLDLVTAGDKTLTASYYGASAEKTFEVITADSAVVKSGAPARVVVGDTVTINGIVVTVTYSDGSTKDFNLTDVTGEGLDFSKAGTVALQYTVNGKSYTHEITVVSVSEIVISGAPAFVYQNDAIDLSGATVTVIYSDGKTENVTNYTYTFNSSNVGMETLTVTYRGVDATVTVEVKGKITITGVEFPEATLSAAQKNNFKDTTPIYTVGDDNAFRIKLDVDGLDHTFTPITVTEYIGNTKIFIRGESTPLSGDALAQYAVIDENLHTIDFTDAAVNKEFTIVFGVAGGAATTTLDVAVKDAFNIYDVKELNFITNGGSYEGVDDNNELKVFYNYDEVTKFLEANNMVRPEKFNGIVLHRNLIITENDIPAGYLYSYKDSTGVARVELFDYMDVYHHELEYGEEFNMYGNFFTVNSYYIPTVVAKIAEGLNDDTVSCSQLFKFYGTTKVTDEYILPENYDHTTMKYNIQNVSFIDSRPTSNDEAEIDRSKLGLIGIKTSMNETNMKNVNMQRYFIAFMPDHDYQTSNLIDCTFFNSWQNHVFVFGNNQYAMYRGETYSAPNANHKPVTLNIINSDLTKCGGPVIIAQHAYVDTAYAGTNQPYLYRESNVQSGPVINVDGTSKLESFVAGTEAWFEAYPGSGTVAAMIKALARGFDNYAPMYGKTGTSYVVSNKELTGTEVPMMNMQILLMANGFSIEAFTNPALTPPDIDGNITVNGVDMVNLNDADGVANGANPVLCTYVNTVQALMGAIPPVFRSSAGGWCFSDGGENIYSLTQTGPGAPDAAVFEGDEIAFYYKGVGMLFGFYH